MKFLIRLALLNHFLGAVALAADPFIDLWLIETDYKTAGFLEKALEDGSMNSAQTENKLDAMVKGRTLTEIARFKQQSGLSGERLEFEKDHKPIKVADGIDIPGGISIEIEPVAGHSDLVDIRFAFQRSVEEGRNKIGAERTNTATSIKGDRWEILSDWGDEKQKTLLLARCSDVPSKENMSVNRLLEVHYDSEIRWCDPSDLKKFELSTPATRARAIAWLIEQSDLIATSGLRMRGGQKSIQENVLEWIHDNNGWDTAVLGWSLDIESTIGPHGKLVDFKLSSHWHPRDAKRVPASPDFTYEIATTMDSGTTLVIEPKTLPNSGPVPVIFIAPTIQIVVDREKRAFNQELPKKGELGTITYPVHPSLMRKLAELTQFNPNPKPGHFTYPNLQNMLENLGLKFPAGTSASFQGSECQAFLRHDRQGHQLFQATLEKHGLSMTKED